MEGREYLDRLENKYMSGEEDDSLLNSLGREYIRMGDWGRFLKLYGGKKREDRHLLKSNLGVLLKNGYLRYGLDYSYEQDVIVALDKSAAGILRIQDLAALIGGSEIPSTGLSQSSVIPLKDFDSKQAIECCMEYFIRKYPSKLPKHYKNISSERIGAEMRSLSDARWLRMSLRDDEIKTLRREVKTPSDLIYFEDMTLLSKLMDVLRTQNYRVQLTKLRRLFEDVSDMLCLLLDLRI